MSEVRIIHLEDNPLDAELVLARLLAEGFSCTVRRVQTGSELEVALAAGPWDLVLADYSLPQFDGMTALRLVRERQPDLPFIFVTGALGEELAIETLRAGATDYVLKHRLERLAPAVQRALREAREREERRRAEQALRNSEERFRLLVESARDHAIITLDPAGLIVSWNAGAERLLGYRELEALGQPSALLFTPGDNHQGAPLAEIEKALREGRAEDERWHQRKDGSRFWAIGTITPLYDDEGRHCGFVKIMRDFTERKQMAEELERRAAQLATANATLAEADRRKDEFLAMLAHELRNPLAPIMTALHILRQQPAHEAHTDRFHQMMERQVRHLVHLVDDLLDISRITQGKITLHKARLDLIVIVRQLLEMIGPQVRQRAQRLHTLLPEQPLWLDGDATRLEQVLQNLLGNAIKYTPEGGRIILHVEPRGARVVVRVIDTGVGIAPEMLPHVFDPFVQARQSLDRSDGGLGVGLTLVRNLVLLHGGQVCAHSNGPNQGSEFAIELPLAVEFEMNVVRSSDAAGQAKPVEVFSSAHPRSALVVDDNTDAAQSMADLLEQWGYQVYVAYDGSVALESARENQPDVVLLDIGLPGMDGYEVARRLRQDPVGRSTLLVAITGYGQDEDRRQAAQAGFDLHFTKPVDLEALLNSLNTAPSRPMSAE